MTQFKIGKTYYMSSPCDQECIWAYKVIARTAKTITLKDENGNLKKCGISRYSEKFGYEFCQPLGKYSMSPILSA